MTLWVDFDEIENAPHYAVEYVAFVRLLYFASFTRSRSLSLGLAVSTRDVYAYLKKCTMQLCVTRVLNEVTVARGVEFYCVRQSVVIDV